MIFPQESISIHLLHSYSLKKHLPHPFFSFSFQMAQLKSETVSETKPEDVSPPAKTLPAAAAKLASPSGRGAATPVATAFAVPCCDVPLGGRKCPAFTAATQGWGTKRGCLVVNDFQSLLIITFLLYMIIDIIPIVLAVIILTIMLISNIQY